VFALMRELLAQQIFVFALVREPLAHQIFFCVANASQNHSKKCQLIKRLLWMSQGKRDAPKDAFWLMQDFLV